jgi:glycosyltransferase involved in cell wall biosynthesis
MHPESSAISIVVPVFNEQEVLREFHRRLSVVLDKLNMPAQTIYVNDGSADDTLSIALELCRHDDRVAVLDLSRNFGKEIALTAGIDHAAGDVVIVIDADLQDPPELIPELLNQWRKGYDVVYAKRLSRVGEHPIKKATAFIFYRLIRLISRVDIPYDTGDYRLLSRRAVEALKQLREQHRYMKGLFAWIGYPQKAVPYQRESRYAGATKWNYWRLWNFAIEGITSFSTAPLKIATYIGFATAMGAMVYGAYMIMRTLIDGSRIPGYPSLLVVILFLGGVQLLSIGVLGEYLGRMYDETKKRPLYFLKGNQSSRSPLKQSPKVGDIFTDV